MDASEGGFSCYGSGQGLGPKLCPRLATLCSEPKEGLNEPGGRACSRVLANRAMPRNLPRGIRHGQVARTSGQRFVSNSTMRPLCQLGISFECARLAATLWSPN